MLKRLVIACLFINSSVAYAVTTVVPPGSGLQAAITAAADGDVILLQTGVYSNADSQIEVGNASAQISLTIKAESASAEPIIADSLIVPATIGVNKLVIQGVQVDLIRVDSGGFLNELELLEVKLVQGGNSVQASANLKKFTMIGSSTSCTADAYIYTIYAGDIVVAGNSFCQWANPFSFAATNQGGKSITVVGNTFDSRQYNSNNTLRIRDGGEVLVAANRFVQRWGKAGDPLYAGSDTKHYYFIDQNTNERFTARNNIFQVTTDRVATGAVVNRISPVYDTANIHFENNVVDAGNMGIWVPGLGEAEQQAMMEESGGVPASLRGNIFVNYDDNVLPLASTGKDLGAKNNLCFNNGVDCGTTDGNLAVDPLFVDTVDYKLDSVSTPSSPAIDAGIVDTALSDLDGTQNDMGAYGGSWSIDQYDAQRDPAATGPYLYPVVDAAKGVANGNVQVKFVSYGRQL